MTQQLMGKTFTPAEAEEWIAEIRQRTKNSGDELRAATNQVLIDQACEESSRALAGQQTTSSFMQVYSGFVHALLSQYNVAGVAPHIAQIRAEAIELMRGIYGAVK